MGRIVVLPLGSQGKTKEYSRETAPMNRLPKRAPYTPYLEIVLAVAVMAFLLLVISGSFNQPSDDLAQVSGRTE
jgi:hypothetical protein